MFEQYGLVDVKTAVEPMIDEMIDLLRLMNSYLEDALGVFISEVIMDRPVARELVGKVLAPEIGQVSIPFWTAMPNKRE